jgi:hypothetical protein
LLHRPSGLAVRCSGGMRGVMSRWLPTGLVDLVCESFGPVLPDDVFLTIYRNRLTILRSSAELEYTFPRLGVFPRLPLPEAVRFPIAVRDVAKAVATVVGQVSNGPWLPPDANAIVAVDGNRLDVVFGWGQPFRTVRVLAPITWSGPRRDRPGDRPQQERIERRFIGIVPPRQLERLRGADREAATAGAR